MSLRRTGTRRVPGGAGPPRPKKGYEAVQQGIKELYPGVDSTRTTDMDIVFVPGLGAHPEDSWKSVKTGFNWASDKDGVARDFPTARVLLYMYESAWTGPLKVKQFIGNLALTLLHGLHEKREASQASGSTRPIVFIGHSMGGLVIAKAVCLADSRRDLFPRLFEDIAGSAVFGTPFHGAEAASVAAMLSQAGQIFDQAVPSKLLDLMKPDDEGLKELRHEFVRMVTKLSPNIGLCGFYEEQPTNISDLSGVPAFIKALQIPLPKKMAEFVTRDSAIIGGLMESMGLACNHRDLVKFESFKDERYSLVRSLLKKIIHGAHLIVKNRRQSTRNIDRVVVTKVMETLDGAQISRKRRQIAQTSTPSSWLSRELEDIGWLAEARSSQESPTATRENCVWIRGPEGRGKTGAALAALEEIDRILEADNDSDSTHLAYFFCDSTPDFSTPEELLKSLARQLVSKQESLAPHAKFLLRKKGKEDSKGQPQLTVENLWQALQDMLADEQLAGSRVYIVVNNLQVFAEDSASTRTLLDLLKFEISSLNQDERPATVRWLITSGDSYSIRQTLRGHTVRLIDLEDAKYGDQVQLELRKHAHMKVSDLVVQKKYSKALAYFASSLLGRRAQNTQWIDITCVQLEELPENQKDLQVRRLLEAMPQELDALLHYAWQQVFELNKSKAGEIKEMLRVLVLTYEDPTETELSLLVGMSASDEQKEELHILVDLCRPLLNLKRTGKSETKVCFIEDVVRKHLLEHAHKLLGLSDEDTKLQHGMLGLRAFTHIMETLNFPAIVKPVDNESVNDGDHELEEDSEHDKDGAENQEEEEEEEDDGATDVASHWNVDNDGDSSSIASADWSNDDWSDSGEDPEADDIKDRALSYAVKHWLRHASNATTEIAEDLSLEEAFWDPKSEIRSRWVTEYNRLTGAFKDFERSEFAALHVACSVGFRDLVSALMKNGHALEITLRDSLFFTPLHLAASFGQLDTIEELLNKGAPIDDGIEDGRLTPLHMAAAEGNVRVMTKLLLRGANPNADCGDYGVVINAAIESGNRDAVKLLVEHDVSLETVEDDDAPGDTGKDTEGADNGEQDVDNAEAAQGGDDDEDENDDEDDEDEDEDETIRSPLALAALRTDLTMFEFLIENYSDKLPPKEFDTALIKAAEHGRLEVFKQLLTSYTHAKEALQEALDGAAYEEHWDIVTLLLEECVGLVCDSAFVSAAQANDEQQDLQIMESMWEYAHESISPETLDESLYQATDFENGKAVQLLLRFGASPDATGTEYGNALTAAAYDGSTHIVELLLDAGANINSPNGWALQTAVAEGHMDIAQLLLSRGADVNAITMNDNMPQGTALQAAIESGHRDIVELLLEHNANPNLGRGEFTCPIIAATRKGEEEILQLLLAAKADVDVLGGPNMSTPLINAAAYLPQSSIQAILNAGADINLADRDGDTALMVAALSSDDASVKFLLEQGADVLLKNKQNKNALESALDGEDADCIQILVDHVSLILEALRVSVASGDAAVTALVRSVENRMQELPYDEPSIDTPIDGNGYTAIAVPITSPSQATEVVVQQPLQVAASATVRAELREPDLSMRYQGDGTDIPPSDVRNISWNAERPLEVRPVQPFNLTRDDAPRATQFAAATHTPFAQDGAVLRRDGTRPPAPGSGPVRRKPAPGSAPEYTGMLSSYASMPALQTQSMRQSLHASPLPPNLPQHPATPYASDAPEQRPSAYRQPRPLGSGGQAQYSPPTVTPAYQVHPYQPLPEQQIVANSNHGASLHSESLQHGNQQHGLRQPGRPLHNVPYPSPPADSEFEKGIAGGVMTRPWSGDPAQLQSGSRVEHDEAFRPGPQGSDPKQHRSSFLGLKAPWSGDRRFHG